MQSAYIEQRISSQDDPILGAQTIWSPILANLLAHSGG